MQTPSKTLSGSITCAVAAGERRDQANKNECAQKLKAIAVKADGSSEVIGLLLGNFQTNFPLAQISRQCRVDMYSTQRVRNSSNTAPTELEQILTVFDVVKETSHR